LNATPVRVALHPGYRVAGCVLMAHLLAGCAALWLPPVAAVIVIAGIVVSAIANGVSLLGRQSPCELSLGADGAIVGRMADGGELSCKLRTYRILAGGLVVMTLQPSERARAIALTLSPGDQPATSLRQLRIWLQWRSREQ
jgi:hypothetical protein